MSVGSIGGPTQRALVGTLFGELTMAQRATKQHPVQTIADEGRKPVTKGETTVGMQESVIPGLRAKGAAVAALIIEEAQKEGTGWTRLYKDVLQLAKEGRDELRKQLAAVWSRPRGSVLLMQDPKTGKAIKDSTPVAEVMRRSARVRLSEFTTITKAIDVGVKMSPEWAFHAAVGYARVGLKAAAVGSTRGRKASTPEEKLKAYLLADHQDQRGGTYNFIRDIGIDGIEALLEELRKEVADMEAAAATEAAGKEDHTASIKQVLAGKAKLPKKTNARVAH